MRCGCNNGNETLTTNQKVINFVGLSGAIRRIIRKLILSSRNLLTRVPRSLNKTLKALSSIINKIKAKKKKTKNKDGAGVREEYIIHCIFQRCQEVCIFLFF